MASSVVGGFVTQAFVFMLKDCYGNKFFELEKAIRDYTCTLDPYFHCFHCSIGNIDSLVHLVMMLLVNDNVIESSYILCVFYDHHICNKIG